MKKSIAITIVALLIINGIAMYWATDSAEGASPHQSIAGKDYQALATARESATLAKAGRKTSGAQDGWDTVYDNRTWTFNFSSQEALLGTDHGLVANGVFDNYKNTNATINGNGQLNIATEFTDDFNDNSIDATWTEKDHVTLPLIEQNGKLESTGIDISRTISNSLLQYDYSEMNNYTITLTPNGTNAEKLNGGITLYNASFWGNFDTTTASNNAPYQISQIMLTTNNGDVRGHIIYKNTSGNNVQWKNDTSEWTVATTPRIVIGSVGESFILNITVGPTDYEYSIYCIDRSVTVMTATIAKTEVKNNPEGKRVVGIGMGYRMPVLNINQYPTDFDNFAMEINPDEAYYQSPVIPTGANNSYFKRLSWDGNNTVTTEINAYVRTGENADPSIGWSAWHPVTDAGDYTSLNYQGSFMQFNFSWVDMNAVISNITFEQVGSSTGIPYNGSQEYAIDRCTRWYGLNISMAHGVNVTHPDVINNKAGFAFRIENSTIEANNYQINVSTVSGQVGNSLIYLSNLTINGTTGTFYNHSWDMLGSGWYSYLSNITTTNTTQLANVNDILGYLADITAIQTGTHEYYINTSGTVERVKFTGGHKGDASTYFMGLRVGNAKNNYIVLSGNGGGGIVCAVTSSDAYGANEANLTGNVVIGNTFYGIVGAPDAGFTYGIKNGTATIYNNVIRGINYTAGLWSSGIHIRQGASNWTVIGNYIYDSDAYSVISAPIMLWNSTKDNTVSQNFVWNCSVTTGILVWLNNSNIEVSNNFIYDIELGEYQGDILPYDSYGIVWYNNNATDNVQTGNGIVDIDGDGVAVFGKNLNCGNDTLLSITGYDYNVSVNSDLAIFGGTHTENFGYETTANLTYYQQSSFNVIDRTGSNANFRITLTDDNITYLPANDTSAKGVTNYWLIKAIKWNGSASETAPSYTAVITVGGIDDATLTENGVEIAYTGSFRFEADANNTYVLTENYVYSDVIQTVDGIFGLLADLGTLLGINIGSAMSGTIQLLIFALFVLIPLSLVTGIIAYAVRIYRRK